MRKRLRLSAIQLRLEPVLQCGRKRRPGALKMPELLCTGAIDAAQFFFDVREINTQAPAFADDQPPVHNHIAQQRRIASREQKLQRIDRHDLVAIETIEIDGHEIGRSAGDKLASSRRPGRAAAVTNSETEEL